MAPHGKEMTTEQKEIVLQMSNAGFSSYKIQDVTGIQARTVQKFLKRVRERGSVENLPRSGRKRKTTIRDDRCLLRSIKKNRRQTLKDATNRFNTRTECGVSCRTIKRRLSENGYKRCVVSKKTTVSQINHEKRSRFADKEFIGQWIISGHLLYLVMKRKLCFEITTRYMFGERQTRD